MKTDRVMRSVQRDSKAIALGLPRVEAEIKHLEGVKRRVRSVKQRLERLYTARRHLIEMPEESASLVDQLKAIQNG
tara:strand:+ start:895 stop:1122 length:228 start_codon:yes stop_codon:yes gene_type:complete